MHKPELDGASVVMLGSFNPAIFHPSWLESQGLIRPEEANNGKITMIQADVADFSCEWFQLQVLQARMMLASTDPRHYSPLRDLASGIFAVLPHTPITAIGLNRQFHFQMPSVEAWHTIGHLLAPKELWTRVMDTPGLRSIQMQGRRQPGAAGFLYIKVEPSVRVQHGLFIEFNEEFRQHGDPPPGGAQWIAQPLREDWDAMMRYSEEAAEHFMSLVR